MNLRGKNHSHKSDVSIIDSKSPPVAVYLLGVVRSSHDVYFFNGLS